MSAPVPASARLHGLDVARGVAICGVLLVNVIGMTGPQAAFMDPWAGGEPSAADLAVFGGVRALVEGKFLTIFSLLFGMGLMLQTRRLDADGRALAVYGRRLALLLLIGIAHGVLLWWGDILTAYALIGAVAFLFRGQSADRLGPLAAVVLGAGLVVTALSYLSLALMTDEAQAEVLEAVRAVDLSWGPAWLQGVTEASSALGVLAHIEIGAFAEGGFAWSLGLRALLYASQTANMFAGYGLVVGGLFLLGMYLVQTDFAGDRARLRRWMGLGLGLGLLAELVGHALCAVGGFDFSLWLGAGEAVRTLGKPAFGIGLLSALLLAAGEGQPPALLRPFAAAGRMALTHYLTHSLVFALVACHWGLGLFGQLSRTQSFGLALGLCAVQVLASPLWLSRFRRGPMEALWRWGTYGRGV